MSKLSSQQAKKIMIKKKLNIRNAIWNRDRKISLWKNKLVDVPCFIIGNAPSLDFYNLSLLDGLFAIGINRSFKKIETTILLWQDIELYYDCRDKLKNIKSILYSRDVADPKGIAYHFRLLNRPYMLTGSTTRLAGHGSSGPLAFQLAHALGCNPIIFLGCDCKYDGKKTDFWGINKDHKSHTLTACSYGAKWIKNSKHKKNIIFCEPSDKDIDTMTLEKIIEVCKITEEHRKGIEYFKKRLFE